VRHPIPFWAALAASLGLHLAGLAIVGLDRGASPAEPEPRTHKVRFLPAPQNSGEPEPDAPHAARDASASGRSQSDRAGGGPEPTERASQPPKPSRGSRASQSQGPPSSPSRPSSRSTLTAEQSPRARDAGPSNPSPDTATREAPLALFPSARETARWQPEPQTARAEADELRHATVQPDTQADVLAAYVAAWLRKVERVGNLNYPEEAREQGITGAVRVEAVLRPDGTLARIRLVESSGHAVLDAAAKGIIRLGAPYSEFGPELRERVDRLHIPHRFVFSQGAELRTGRPGG
jgi:protein TonB